ncbi:DUF3617 domain-containing protein [Sphingomonas arenae]|uniref:DUF3617 domain-containing protein n=1 Tax=Sphingomonas arenae TaxID=2812555 RepID=UPI0019685D7A|nr:DUF3617 domain-containing protein [Sphingomonas arenae]
MRTPTIMLAGAVLAGCGGGDETVTAENASVGEVQQKLREAGRDEQFVRPGRWEQRATLVDIDVPGMPADMRAGMKKAMGTSQTHVTCLTPEQARNPREDFFAGADKSCRYETFRWGGGQIDVRMRCGAEGRQQTMALNGTYSPDSYQMNMRVQGQGDAPDQQMTMSMRVEASRVGECSGGESKG